MPNEQEPVTVTNADGTETEFEISTADTAEGNLADEIVEALFDDGSGNADDVTFADTDGDGKIDAGAADTDGDGEIDTVVGDTDGDGRVDAAAADTDGDGQLDAIVMDTDGDGIVDAAGEDTDGDGNIDVAYFDTDGDGEFDTVVEDTDGDGQPDEISSMDAGLPTDEELSTNSVEFTVGEDGFPITDEETPDEFTAQETDELSDVSSDEYVVEASPDLGGDAISAKPVQAEPDLDASTSDTSEDQEMIEQQAHADAAAEAQSAADEFVAKGDYAAASEAREVAENEAWEAGDSSMLGASDAIDLDNAAYKQEVGQDYQAQQAEHIAEGDYESAKEDALNAGYAIGDADFQAGGSDHTGQADQDAYNLGNAVHDEKNAEYFANNAAGYAEQGNFDAADRNMDLAGDYQASADGYADQANPASEMYDVDPSSGVEAGGGYDMSAVDTGFDAGVDTSVPEPYDSGIDDGTV